MWLHSAYSKKTIKEGMGPQTNIPNVATDSFSIKLLKILIVFHERYSFVLSVAYDLMQIFIYLLFVSAAHILSWRRVLDNGFR
jgi:hypothetical protein